MTTRSIYNFILAIVIINVLITLQGHFFPFTNNFFPVTKILALSTWGLKHFLIFQPITFFLIHYDPVFNLSYLINLLFYIYLLKKCADFFIIHNKTHFFLLLYLVPTALSSTIYILLLGNQLPPLFAPYLSLVSIMISSTLLDPNLKILRPVHPRPFHNGIRLKWATLIFVAYQITLGSLSHPPLAHICLINLLVTYVFAIVTLKSNSQMFLLKSLEKFLHRAKLLPRKSQESRIDRILNKISKGGMKSLSFLDRLYLRIKNSHFS